MKAVVAHAVKEDGRYWTKARILEAFKEFADEMGRGPAVFDAHFRVPSWRAKYTAARISESERAYALGLRLPSADICCREFGSWENAVVAAGLMPNSPGARAVKPREGTLRNMSSVFVCPSCGAMRWRMDDVTGWCATCTRELAEAAA